MFLIAGLGNPERKYEGTRHNVGFDAVDALAARCGVSSWEKKHRALCANGVLDGERVLFAKPQTYMNLSGESIAEIVHYYKLDPAEQLLVLFDDISLEPGMIRVRKKGSAGGHNGIKNIIACLGTQDFMRIKIGVGEKPEGGDLVGHVLGHFAGADRAAVDEAITRAGDAAILLLHGETEQAMNLYNAKRSAAE